MTGSSFGWLDYSEAQRRQMLEIVDLFRDRTTLDELGFGSIRDAFSDHFFPGINTLQTRARYFLFVPWIYLQIERERTPFAQVDRRARYDQAALARALQNGGQGQNDGVIGILRGEALQRTPAALYWTGLRRFTIWQFPGSMAEYYTAIQRPGPPTRAVYSDDGEMVELAKLRSWHPGLPPEPEGLLESATFSLTREEADYLGERICVCTPGSLLALCINSRYSLRTIDYPWLHPDLASFPGQLQRELEHSRRFSVTSYGASLLYNLMLAEKAIAFGLPIAPEQQPDRLRGLVKDTAAERAELRGWHLAGLWDAVTGKGHRIDSSTREFVGAIVTILSEKPEAYVDDEHARRLIERRELALKGGLARLTHRRALERLAGLPALYDQTYRWPNVQRIVGDIRAGIARKDASELLAHA